MDFNGLIQVINFYYIEDITNNLVNKCFDCHKSCFKCLNNYNYRDYDCTECSFNKYLRNFKLGRFICRHNCPNKHFKNSNKKCEKCHYCSQCEGNNNIDSCIGCNYELGYVLKEKVFNGGIGQCVKNSTCQVQKKPFLAISSNEYLKINENSLQIATGSFKSFPIDNLTCLLKYY